MNRQKITRAMDYLDDDLIAGAAKENAVKVEKTPFFANLWVRWGAVATAAILLLSGGIGIVSAMQHQKTIAVVAFDVNPSLEIEVNDREEVVKVNAFNEEAKIVLEDMNFKGVGLDITVNALIGSMLKHGYLSVEKNSILISIHSKDGEKASVLRRDISNNVSALLLGSNIQAAVMTQTFDGKREHDGVSAAKAALIDKIIASGMTRSDGSKYTYEQLSALRVHELKLMLDSKGFDVSGVETSGTANVGKYIGEEKALALSCQHAEVSVDLVQEAEVELDFDDDANKMLYEVEFVYEGFEYEYELDAITGAIIEFEREADD